MKKAIITGGSSFHQNFFTNKNGKYKNFFDEKIYLIVHITRITTN